MIRYCIVEAEKCYLLFGFRIRRAVGSIIGNSSEMEVVTSLLVKIGK